MSPTKVENNHRKCNGFAPLFFEVVADTNFAKTKLQSNSDTTGKQTLFFAYWDSRLCSRLYACISPQNTRYITQIQMIIGFLSA